MNPHKAHAKVNMYLAVGEVSQGFHPIESLFCLIELHDELVFKKVTSGFEVNLSGPYAKDLNGKNLLERIWEDLSGSMPEISGIEISLKKNIPVCGGLGGGSSDAAVFLRYLYLNCHLFGDIKELFKYAYDLGKDIPFFLTGWPAANVAGIQNKIEYFDMPCGDEIFLFIPEKGASTSEVFKKFDLQNCASVLTRNEEISKIQFICKNCSFTELGEVGFNDLENSFFSLCPEYGEVFDLIKENSWFARLSGSGSTIFFIPKNKDVFLDMYGEKLAGNLKETKMLGCSQVERQWVLVPPFEGSSPSTPARILI